MSRKQPPKERSWYHSRLIKADKAHCWHPFTPVSDWESSDPLVIRSGEGVRLTDMEGKTYYDGTSSLWCAALGHRHPRLDQALILQVETLAHSTFLGMTHPQAILLADKLASLAPSGLTRVFYSDSGATAVEIALKMAFQYHLQKPVPEPKRTRFMALTGAYHGDTLGDVSVGGVDRFHATFRPLLFETVRVASPHCYRCPLALERATCGIACLEEARKTIDEHAETLAAVVIEPLMQGAAGMISHPPGYLAGIAEHCRGRGVLLIADEVAVGIGRTGTMVACEQEDVSPDFLCLAKGLTGGYLPLAATLTTDTVYDAFRGDANDPKTFYHGHTFTGNPLGSAVALAVLEAFEEERILENVRKQAKRVADVLHKRLSGCRIVGQIRQRGLMIGIELVADRASKKPFAPSIRAGAKVCAVARDAGVLIRPLGDVVTFLPPLISTSGEIDAMLKILVEAIERFETEVV